MEPGKIYEIFVSDGAIHSEIGLLISPGDTMLDHTIFLVNGHIRKYSRQWYTFREIKDDRHNRVSIHNH